jgi:hypothetical protein
LGSCVVPAKLSKNRVISSPYNPVEKSNNLALMASVGDLKELLEYSKESLIWINE